MEFSIQTNDPLATPVVQRLPDDCVLRICDELAPDPLRLMQWLEDSQPHIRWGTGECPIEGLPRYARQFHALFIEKGYMSYSDNPEYDRDKHTHLLNPDFSFKRIEA